MAITTQAFDREVSGLQDEVHQVLIGSVKAHRASRSEKIEEMKALTTQEWQIAARALLLVRKASILEGLSTQCLEAVVYGHVDVCQSLSRAIELADEHAAMRRIQEIASRRLNLPAQEPESVLHSLETGLVHDALMEAYVSGANSRFA